MKIPIQARPIVRKVSTAKILASMLVQSLSTSCSKKGEMCGGFGAECCSGLSCRFSGFSPFGRCEERILLPIL
jgi:hypothetical protein